MARVGWGRGEGGGRHGLTQFLARLVCFSCQSSPQNSPPRLVVPNKGYSSLDQSPDEKPLVALDTDRCVQRHWGSRASHSSLCKHTSGLYRTYLLYCRNWGVPPSVNPPKEWNFLPGGGGEQREEKGSMQSTAVLGQLIQWLPLKWALMPCMAPCPL